MANTEPDVTEADEAPETPEEPTPEPAQRDADAEVKKAYAKLRTAEKEAEKLKARLAQIEEAQLSENEKLARRADEAEQKLTLAEQRIRKANLLSELSKPELGIVNAQAAAKLIDGIEYDDEGEPSNLAEVLPVFLENHSFLLQPATPLKPKAPAVNAGDGTGDETQHDLTADELEAARRYNIPPERYAAMKRVRTLDDFQQVRAKSQ